MAAATNVPVSVMDTAGEGGAWGIALLASYMVEKQENESLDQYLNNCVFKEGQAELVMPEEESVKGFEVFLNRYRAGFEIEHAAIKALPI